MNDELDNCNASKGRFGHSSGFTVERAKRLGIEIHKLANY
jgi:hypothetical protein